MIDSQQVADVMGGPDVLGRGVQSLRTLESLVHDGLPKEALRRVVERALADRAERRQLLYRIMPEGNRSDPSLSGTPMGFAALYPSYPKTTGCRMG
jgi:hypothetical protein